MSKTNKIITSFILVAALFITTAATVFAAGRPNWVKSPADIGGFINSAEQRQNVFLYNSTGEEIEIIEPNWPDIGKNDIKIGEKVIKEVKVHNKNKQTGFVVMKVEVPTISAKMPGDEANKAYDQFILNWNTEDYALLYEKKATVADSVSVYYYALRLPIRPDEYTDYLFTEMQVPKFASVEKEYSGEVVVTAKYLGETYTHPRTGNQETITNVLDAFDLMGEEFVPGDYVRHDI